VGQRRKIPYHDEASYLEGTKVSVHWHLIKKCFSIRPEKQTLIACHTDQVALENVVFKVSERGRQTVIANKKRMVHARVWGRVVGKLPWTCSVPVSYNPYKHATFYDKKTEDAVERAPFALLKGGVVWVPSNRDHTIALLRSCLSEDLLHDKYREQDHPMAGHCYVASEALYHLLGGSEQSFKPCCSRDAYGGVHWWLEDDDGHVLDPTFDQYVDLDKTAPYASGVRKGFLTTNPSARAVELIQRVKGVLAC
jgi:hypothetical protein